MTLGPCQPAAASGGQEAHPATPYQQAVHPPRQVRFASPITKAEATTSQSQSVAKRGRPQTREPGGHWEQASHSRTRKDRSSTQGSKRRRGITSEDPMEDLMDFVPSFVLHMSPLRSLNGRRRKKEDLGTMGQMPRQD